MAADDLDCVFSSPQKLTIRPNNFDDSLQLTIEAYGLPGVHLAVDLVPQARGDHFRFARRGLEVQGRLLSHSPESGAIVDLESVTFQGTPLCLPGVYFFPGES